MDKKINQVPFLLREFKTPILILAGILLYLLLNFLGLQTISLIVIIGVIILGSFGLFKKTFISLIRRRFALDYIAILAIIVALFTREYLVASILALMISSGGALEEYGVSQAKKSLSKLVERIPDEVILWKKGRSGKKEKIKNIKVGDEILIRKGEVIGLDGILMSDSGLTDESSLTGEPYIIDKIKGDLIRSGTINQGDPIIVRVSKAEKDSTYKKIIDMVKKAQDEKSPMIRLADKYSILFTIITLTIAGFALIYSKFDLTRVLAVLAIATPCPLIIATPIALLGGVNASSKKRIIVKKLASLEVFSRISAIIFDKTGTITLGKPELVEIENFSKNYSEEKILGIAEAIERNSLHPLAKAIVIYTQNKKVPLLHASNIEEKIGVGISGAVGGKQYTLSKLQSQIGMAIALTHLNKQIAIFRFEDEVKQESREIIKRLKTIGLELYIFTGDKKEAAERVVSKLGENVVVKAECTPKDKQDGIEELKKNGKVTAMVGDGINDAPALALADVGLVFSNEEQTAASEAADIVFLGGDFSLVHDSYMIAKRTISIARQSIVWGIGASIAGMALASLGFIPPIAGAGLQEVIDVAVIINALRASR